MSKERLSDYWPEDIAKAIVEMGSGEEELPDTYVKDCEEALHWLKAAAENPYNHGYFAALYMTLGRAAENVAR